MSGLDDHFPYEKWRAKGRNKASVEHQPVVFEGAGKGLHKKQHWTIQSMLWWFQFVEEKGEMMEHQWL